MTIKILTDHANELIVVDEVLDPGGSAVVALGLTNQDGSDTFPGRTLTPDQAEELAASLAQAAAAARASAGLAPAPLVGEQPHGETLQAIRAAVPLTSTGPAPGAREQQQAEASAPPPAAPKAPPKPAPKTAVKTAPKAAPKPAPRAAPSGQPKPASGQPKPTAPPRASGKKRTADSG
jgi:hypothetical protein